MQGMHGGKRRKESSNEVKLNFLASNRIITISYEFIICYSMRKSSNFSKISIYAHFQTY